MATKLGMRLGAPLFVVTYHPATLSAQAPEAAMAELLAALEEFAQATIVFTHPNADAGGRDTRMVCIVAAPEGVKVLEERHPEVDVYTAALDERLNDKAYIVPGLGDFGDRLFGTGN